MKMKLAFVPPDGGEADYSLEVDLPAIPRPGDYVSIMRKGRRGEAGTDDFVVKRTWWRLTYDDAKQEGKADEVWVECYFAVGPFSTDGHRQSAEHYRARTGKLIEFDESMY